MKLDHDCLCMAVLVQEIVNADYAFVIHTTNPSSGDSSEIYAEVIYSILCFNFMKCYDVLVEAWDIHHSSTGSF